ncbi:TVP38/TMEM64 family protein [Rhodococcus aerolatus]
MTVPPPEAPAPDGPPRRPGWRGDPRARLVLGALLLAGLVVAALVLPVPTPEDLRGWAREVGPAFPLVFLALHAVVTITPVPRTVFTVSAGLLFGPVTGVAVTVTATVLSALAALLLVRAVGREAVARRLRHRALRSVDERLARRGWPAVLSLRLIPVVPFSLLNYSCGVSAVRVGPYLAGTVVGILPGTVAVVVLGDALTGSTSPLLVAISVAGACLGLLGLVVDAKVPVRG